MIAGCEQFGAGNIGLYVAALNEYVSPNVTGVAQSPALSGGTDWW